MLLLALLLAGCDDYPRDPNHTLEEVTGGEMRVGLVQRPPWTELEDGEPRGVEATLVRELADSLGAQVAWTTGREADVLQALERHALDLVVSGLTAGNPWSAHLAFTRPYYHEELVVAAPRPLDVEDLDGRSVAVTPGSVAAALVSERGGTPVPAPADAELKAVPDWQVGEDEVPVLILQTDRHVFAVPRGENAWLIAVDRFLRARGGSVRTMLEAAR